MVRERFAIQSAETLRQSSQASSWELLGELWRILVRTSRKSEQLAGTWTNPGKSEQPIGTLRNSGKLWEIFEQLLPISWHTGEASE